MSKILKCSWCNKYKELKYYHVAKECKRGYQYRCKTCHKLRPRKKYQVKYFCRVCKVKVDTVVSRADSVMNLRKVCAVCVHTKSKGKDSLCYKGTDCFTGRAYAGWRCSAKKRGYKWAVTKEELNKVYNKQGGICALSGLKMEEFTKGILRPSLDRIDATKPYILSNVQFVCVALNVMKNKYSEKQFIEFCESVVKYRGSDRALK